MKIIQSLGSFKLLLIVVFISGSLACTKQKNQEEKSEAETTNQSLTKDSESSRSEDAGFLNIYNWSDYIGEETIPNFENTTGVKVTYDVFDNNDVLLAKVSAGKSGYDIIVPSSNYVSKMTKMGILEKIDRTKIPNYKNLDPTIMKTLTAYDEGNQFAIPYEWGTTGIGYNVDKIKELLNVDALDSWEFVFEEENLKKLAECGVTALDAGEEIIPPYLAYKGRDPVTKDENEYKFVQEEFLGIRKYFTYFHSSKYINDLANGDICVAIGWSGDILQARQRAIDAENGVNIAYSIPKQGTSMFIDAMVILSDSENKENAYKFINYVLDPQVMAGISNYVGYGNAVPSSLEFMDDEVKNDPGIFPPNEVLEKLFLLPILNPNEQRALTSAWTKIKTTK